MSHLRKVIYVPGDSSILVINEHGPPLSEQGEIKITKFDLGGNPLTSKSVLENTQYFSFTSDIELSNDGNIFAYYSSRKEGTSNEHEIKIHKFNIDLTEIWTRNYDELKSDLVSDIKELPSGEILILSKSSNLNDSQFDVILSKTDNSGNMVWRKSFGSSSSDQGHKIMKRMNGNIVITGNTNHETGSDAKFDLFLIETDSEGNPL